MSFDERSRASDVKTSRSIRRLSGFGPRAILRPALKGNSRALAQLLTLLENEGQESRDLYAAVFQHAGRAQVVGITGPPGVGKSTLTDRLAELFRQRKKTVGIVCVDPTSPFSRGAILGDRIRMQRLAADRGIFIRSMASRGSLGGIAHATARVASALDASGKNVVIVETVGTGQAEMDVAALCHTVILVIGPQSGDAVQALKAGVLEVADIVVVNKADLPGADETRRVIEGEIRAAMTGDGEQTWKPPVLLASAGTSMGVADLLGAVASHGAYLKESGVGASRMAEQMRSQVMSSLKDHLAHEVNATWQPEWDRDMAEAVLRKRDPESAALAIMTRFLSRAKSR